MLKSTLLALVAQCAPNVSPDTLLAIIKTESSGKPWAIGINRGKGISQPASQEEAIRTAKELASKGANFDMGLGQINSSNMRWLGLSYETVFDPCTNITAAAKVLSNSYKSAIHSGVQNPLGAALSMYNTGSSTQGYINGYVTKVYRNHGSGVGRKLLNYEPIVNRSASEVPGLGAERDVPTSNSQIKAVISEPPKWDVFAHYQWKMTQQKDVTNDTIYSQN